MVDRAFEKQSDYKSALDGGLPVRFDLTSPCRSFEQGLLCNATEAYITVRTYGTSFHYQRRCVNGHYIDNVKHAEVELHFGLVKTSDHRSVVRDALTPSKRVAFNVTLRDQFTCVYCGRRVGDVELDGTPVVIGADHIIAKRLIDADTIRRDRELFLFARD